MAYEVLTALISAGAGLGGVYLGAWSTTRRDEARAAAQVKQERHYLAALVGAHLDRYAAGCLDVAYDDGTSEGRPAGDDGQYHQATVPTPAFEPLALTVEWKCLPAELMYTILALPSQAEEVKRLLADPGMDDPPDFPAWFYTRQIEHARLGLAAASLARRLRNEVDMPAPPLPDGALPVEEHLRQRRERLEKEEISRAKYWARTFVPPPSAPPAATPGPADG